MTLQAIIFDVDGTLADTERDGHLVAFNAAFAECGLDWVWDEALYGRLLAVAGGVERMAHYARESGRVGGVDDEHLHTQLRAVHARKTAHYVQRVRAGAVQLRPGVARLIGAARLEGVRLAIATTTTRENVLALLTATLGPEAVGWFDVIATAQEVARKKPDPAVYQWALAQLGLVPAQALAIEDSWNGLSAARGAGVPCLVTRQAYTRHEDFTGAIAVLDDLEHHPRGPGHPVTLEDLRLWQAGAIAGTAG